MSFLSWWNATDCYRLCFLSCCSHKHHRGARRDSSAGRHRDVVSDSNSPNDKGEEARFQTADLQRQRKHQASASWVRWVPVHALSGQPYHIRTDVVHPRSARVRLNRNPGPAVAVWMHGTGPKQTLSSVPCDFTRTRRSWSAAVFLRRAAFTSHKLNPNLATKRRSCSSHGVNGQYCTDMYY